MSPDCTLYCITLFLSEKRLSAAVASLAACGIQAKEETCADHTGEKCSTFHAKSGGVPVMLAPANGFHYDGDYELGLTVSDSAHWDALLAKAEAAQLALETGVFPDDESRYAIPQAAHGPFFFIAENTPAKKDCGSHIKLSATMTEADLALYNTKIRPLLHPALADALCFERGSRFALQSLSAGSWQYCSSAPENA